MSLTFAQQLKHLFIILFMLVYGLSSSGMTINLHYCCGKLDAISLTGKHSKGCAMGEEIKMSNCCNDEQISVKVNPDQEPFSKSLQVNKAFVAVPFSAPVFTTCSVQHLSVSDFPRKAPPPLPSIPLFIKHCSFRI